MGMGGGTGCLKAPYSRGRLSPRHFYPPSPLLLGCHAECVRVRVHFFGILTSNLGFSEAECLIIGSQMDFGTPKGYGFLWIPSVKWMILECEEKS